MRFLLLLPMALILFVGCGGGGLKYPNGALCPANYDPLPFDLSPDSTPRRISLDPDDNQLDVGEYTMSSYQIYYRQSATGPRIHIKNTPSAKKAGEFNTQIACVNGVGLSTKIPPQRIVNVSGLSVDSNGNTTFVVRDALIGFDRGVIKDFAPGDGSGFSKPSKVYEGLGKEVSFYKMSPTDDRSYIIRFRQTLPNGALVYAWVQMTRQPPQALY